MTVPGNSKHASSRSPNSADENRPALEWTCHPVRRRPWVSVLVSLFAIILVVVVYYTTLSKAFAVLALVVLYASLAKFYFPTRYRLTAEGITVKTVTQTIHKDWSLYRSCYADKNGILLSPFVRPSRLENFRGLYLMFAGNRDEVTELVKEQIRKNLETESQSNEARR